MIGLVVLSFFLSSLVKGDVVIYKMKGSVEFIDSHNQILQLKEGDKIEDGVMIKTSSSSAVEIIYDDVAMVFLSENSRFVIEKSRENSYLSKIWNLLSIPLWAEDKGEEGWVSHLWGKAIFLIRRIDKRYSIKTPTAVIGVRGTSFGIVADDEKSEVGLFKGVIEIEKEDKRIKIEPGQLAVITKSEIKIENRLSVFMEKERKRAEKLERYFDKVIFKLKKREEIINKKMEKINRKLKR